MSKFISDSSYILDLQRECFHAHDLTSAILEKRNKEESHIVEEETILSELNSFLLCKYSLSFVSNTNMAAGHVSENALYRQTILVSQIGY